MRRVNGVEQTPRRHRRTVVTSYEMLGSGCGELAEQSKHRSRAFVMRFDDLIELASFENREVLEEVEDRLNLDQRTSRDVCEAAEFLCSATTDAFSQVEHNAITSATPLIRKIAFGCGESIDEGTRHYCKPSRVLVCLQVFEDHART